MEYFALSSSEAVSEAASEAVASASGSPMVWILLCVAILAVAAVFLFFRFKNKAGKDFAPESSNRKTAKFICEDRQLLDLLCDIAQTYEDSQKN